VHAVWADIRQRGLRRLRLRRVVRIAGFSAYFVELAPASQADLISRTELNL
jgi:hypothetical protein